MTIKYHTARCDTRSFKAQNFMHILTFCLEIFKEFLNVAFPRYLLLKYTAYQCKGYITRRQDLQRCADGGAWASHPQYFEISKKVS